jgi:hypothetical protein
MTNKEKIAKINADLYRSIFIYAGAIVFSVALIGAALVSAEHKFKQQDLMNQENVKWQ